jgi:hypothetical protein
VREPSFRKEEGLSGPEAEKEKDGSSSASQDGRTVSGSGLSVWWSCGEGREEMRLFFWEDVLKGELPGQLDFRWILAGE